MAVYLFGFDYIFDLYYFRLALFSGLAGLYIRFLIHFINSENWVKTYSQFSTFVFLPLTGYVITSAISNNIALSLGMVGALSIVRFRTPVKNPSELIMYFILITLGIVTNVDPSKTVTFLLLITLASVGLEIYKFVTKRLNLAIYNFNEKDIYLNLVLSVDYPQLVSKKEFIHISKDEDKFSFRFKSNNKDKLLEIKKLVDEKSIVSYSIDDTTF
tara:strand:+ start:479 stop:1123 length:645 start_codon:yes stop_codon:yes gene_type:complete